MKIIHSPEGPSIQASAIPVLNNILSFLIIVSVGFVNLNWGLGVSLLKSLKSFIFLILAEGEHKEMNDKCKHINPTCPGPVTCAGR